MMSPPESSASARNRSSGRVAAPSPGKPELLRELVRHVDHLDWSLYGNGTDFFWPAHCLRL
jgi:hypothetical protein